MCVKDLSGSFTYFDGKLVDVKSDYIVVEEYKYFKITFIKIDEISIFRVKKEGK